MAENIDAYLEGIRKELEDMDIELQIKVDIEEASKGLSTLRDAMKKAEDSFQLDKQLKEYFKAMQSTEATASISRMIKMHQDMGNAISKAIQEADSYKILSEATEKLSGMTGAFGKLAEKTGHGEIAKTLGLITDGIKGFGPAASIVAGVTETLIELAASIEIAKTPAEEFREALEQIGAASEEIRLSNKQGFDENRRQVRDARAYYSDLVRLMKSGASDGAINAVMDNLLEQLPEAESLIRRMSNGRISIDTAGMEELFAYYELQNEYDYWVADARVQENEMEEALYQKNLARENRMAAKAELDQMIKDLGLTGESYFDAEGTLQLPAGYDLTNLRIFEDANFQKRFPELQAASTEYSRAEREAEAKYNSSMENMTGSRERADEVLQEMGAMPAALGGVETAAAAYTPTDVIPDFSVYATEQTKTLQDAIRDYEEALQMLDVHGAGALPWIESNLGLDFDSVKEARGETGLAAAFRECVQEWALENEKVFSELDLAGMDPELRTILMGYSHLLEEAGTGSQSALEELVSMAESGVMTPEVYVYNYGGQTRVFSRTNDDVMDLLGGGYNPNLHGYAEGTSYFPGGLTQINERGDEMVELPEGSKIYPAQRSRGYEQVGPSVGNYTINVYGMTVREEADIDRIATQLYHRLQLAALNR